MCPSGKYGNQSGVISVDGCKNCSTGTFSLAGQSSCLTCASGMINTRPGAPQCKQCPLPKVPNGAKNKCVCPPEHYLNASDACITPCPLGVNCRSSGSVLETLNVEPGWWRVPSNASTEVQKCPFPETCLGGKNRTLQCRNGTTGVLCALCKQGYYHNSNQTSCLPCKDQSTWLLIGQVILAVLLLIGLLMGVLRMSRGKGQGFVRPLISLAQNLSIVIMYDAPWPEALKTIYKYTFKLQVDFIALVNPACSDVTLNFYLHFIGLCLFFIVFCLIVTRFLWFDRKILRVANDEEKSSNAIRDVFIAILLFYPGITGMALRFFRCRKVDDDYYLMADLNLKCYDTSWWSMLIIVASVLLLFSVGVPVIIGILLNKYRDKLENEDVKKLIGSIYSPYRKDCYYFECVKLLLKAMMWVSLVMFNYKSTVQLAFALALNIFQLCLQVALNPFGGNDRVVINRMQTVQLSLTTIMSLGALSMAYIVKCMESRFASKDEIKGFGSNLTLVQWLLTAFNIISYVLILIPLVRKYGGKVKKQLHEFLSNFGSRKNGDTESGIEMSPSSNDDDDDDDDRISMKSNPICKKGGGGGLSAFTLKRPTTSSLVVSPMYDKKSSS